MMSLPFYLRFILLTIVSLYALPALSKSTIQLIQDSQSTYLSDQARILVEQQQQLSIEQVRKMEEQFDWPLSSNPNYGLHSNGVWLHTRFSNVTNKLDWVIDVSFAHLDKVDFYLLDGKKVLASSHQGRLQHQQQRFPTFKVDLPYATTLDLYIRLASPHNNIIAPLHIQPDAVYMRLNFWDNLLWGLFYGGLLVLAIYNLALYFSNKEPALLAYVGYIGSAVIWQFVWGGHLIMLFPGETTQWFSQHMDLIFVLIGIASGIFTYTFLEVKHTAPKTTPFINTNIILLLIMGFMSFSGVLPVLWQNALVYLISLFAITSYMFAGFESYLNNFRYAKYFIFAWTILAVGALIGMLSLIGMLPSNKFTTYCFQVGIFIEAGLFSLALMDKSRHGLEVDIQQATKDLRNNMEFIEEQNARLDIARKDAINASNIKSRFLANMSHEIRTPLNVILGFSKELNRIPLPVDKQEHVRIINTAADSLLSIVNDVLDVSKIEAGKLHISNQPFSPNDVLEEMVSIMSKSAHQKGLEFVFNLQPIPEKLVGDAQRIKQVLTNLLGNALKFTETGCISLNASGTYLQHEMYELRFTVEDTGIGISQQDRAKLFNAFSQVDSAISRPYQGTGLGLVISQQLVRLMGGKISLESTPGKGSQFSVTIRTNLLNNASCFDAVSHWQGKQILNFSGCSIIRESTNHFLRHVGAMTRDIGSIEELQKVQQRFDILFITLNRENHSIDQELLESIENIQYEQLVLLHSTDETTLNLHGLRNKLLGCVRLPLTINKLNSLNQEGAGVPCSEMQTLFQSMPSARILAVDDMEMNLRLLRTWLAPSPLELTLAYSGQEAVDLCKTEAFELILMDVQMPAMDGLQASRLIRKTELNQGTPIIAVTAHAMREEQERLLTSGMDDYLPKPIELKKLLDLILTWCTQEQHLTTDIAAIDWQLALERANHNEDAAREVFHAFIQQLPLISQQIERCWQEQNLTELQNHIHKLHGACCYTGVPNLRAKCDEIESALKRGDNELASQWVPELLSHIHIVIEQAQAM